MDPKDADAAEAAIRQALAADQPFSIDFRIRSADEEEDSSLLESPAAARYLKLSFRAVRSEDGEPLWLEGFAADLTEQKRLERGLADTEADIARNTARPGRPDVRSGLMTDTCEARLREIVETIPQIVWASGPDGRLDYLSESWLAFYGTRDTLDPISDFLNAIHPDDRKATARAWRRSLSTGEPFEAHFRIRHHSADYLWTLARAQAKRDDQGRIVRWYGTCTDVHQHVLAQEELTASGSVSRSIVDASPDPVSLLDVDGTILWVNHALLKGWETHGIEPHIGSIWGSRTPAVRRRYAEAVACARKGKMARFITRLDDGRPKWWDIAVVPIRDSAGAVTRLVAISRDITVEKEAAERAEWAANHDALTRLPNRFFFQKRIEAAIAPEEPSPFALLLLDVDKFKLVNDALGHDAGDALLCAFADRLREVARDGDTVARLGGDEFAVLLPDIGSEAELDIISARLLEALREPWTYKGDVVECGSSIGATFFPAQGTDKTELMKQADMALYAAKAAGRGNCKLFQAAMRTEDENRTSMLNLARDALSNEWLLPYYQPKVHLATGRLSGFEALLRWKHPRNGLQLPSTISAAFEDVTLVRKLHDRITAAVLSDIRRWLDEGLSFGHVALDAPAALFRDGSFGERFLSHIEQTAVPADVLQLEITEAVFTGRDPEQATGALTALAAAGVKIVLERFGTAAGSLTHLCRLPIRTIKVDRSFVEQVELGGSAPSIAKAVIAFARSLGIDVAADGVAKEAQHRFLRDNGCGEAQGDYYGRPVPAAGAVKILRAASSGRSEFAPPAA